MGWNDFYRRRDVMDAVIRQARRSPALPFDEIPGAAELFGTRQNLLLALQHRWNQLLSGHLRAELADPDEAPDTDQVDAVARAWRKTVTEHATLHAVLEANLDAHPMLQAAHDAERKMLVVTAGLADPGEPPAEIRRVGSAFGALLRNGPVRRERRRGPVSHILRMLAPSA
ncbi:hypothetical protein AB5J62_29575 [Amycolatopsis sp. cg5]|uniref:hypothetical protein n=1 Tax=Amycolatopsis sp. cg5 TaxID=3238802 RepID=UPI0035252B40